MAEPGRTEEVLRIGSAFHYFLWTRCQLYGIEVARKALARLGGRVSAIGGTGYGRLVRLRLPNQHLMPPGCHST
jgi:hypothetical protein